MKKTLLLLLITALFLTGCANSTVSDKAVSTPLEATADQATADEAVEPAVRYIPESPSEVLSDVQTMPTSKPEELMLSKYNRILNTALKGSAVLDTEEIYQYPELPTGCEAVSLTIALNCMGAKLDKTDVAEKYLEYSDNFAIGFCGDPFTDDGAGIFPPGLVQSAWNYINDTGAKLYPIDTSGLSMEELYHFIDAGSPVIVWTTVYMAWPYDIEIAEEYNGEYYPWYDLEHCVCMYGYDIDNGEIYISDPQQGNITVSAYEFEEIYDEIGRYSMTLIDTKDI